jgi:hypothetical protein
MSFDQLLDVTYSAGRGDWTERNKAALAALFGSGSGPYPQVAAGQVALRAPKMSSDSGVPSAAYIHPSNPTSGAYSGFSFVMFPSEDSPCLIGSRSWHARPCSRRGNTRASRPCNAHGHRRPRRNKKGMGRASPGVRTLWERSLCAVWSNNESQRDRSGSCSLLGFVIRRTRLQAFEPMDNGTRLHPV